MKRPHFRRRAAQGRGVELFPDRTPGFFGRIVHRLRAFLSYFVLAGAGALVFVFFKLLNFTTVIGRHHVPRRTSILLVSNHRTMFDSFLVAGLTFFPEGLFYPSLAPYHAAAKENYFRWYHLGVFRLLRCIPVRAGRKDLEAMNAIKEALTDGNVHLFYQGRRSQDLDEARDGIGYIVYNARPIVVPVYFSGIEKVFGRKWEVRSLFRRIKLVYGRSIDFMDLYSLPNTKDTWTRITQRVVQNVKALARDVGDETA